MDEEIWRAAVGFEIDYQVSNHGRVWRITRARRAQPFVPLSPAPNDKGYLYVNLYPSDGPKTHMSIHRLVAAAFLTPPTDSKWEVNHIDGVKANNHVSNLELTTRLENMRHAWKLGLMPQGERRGHARLTDDAVREIRRRFSGGDVTKKALAKEFGVGSHTIFDVVNGNTWKHVGDQHA